MILVAGTVAIDNIRTPLGERRGVLGGSGSHFSMAVSILAPVNIVSIVGSDFPKKYLKYLEKKDIGISGIQYSDKPSFRWTGHYERDLDVAHTDETVLGVLESFHPTLTPEERKADFLFLANIDPDVQWDIYSQMEGPKFIGIDSMNYWIESKPKELWKILKEADVLFLNDDEIRDFSQEVSLIKAAKKIQKKGPKLIVVKCGVYGAMLISKKFIFSTSAYPTEEVKDPTGAGDSFAGGFVSYIYLKSIIKGKSIDDEDVVRQAAVWGASIASFCVEDFSVLGTEKATKEKVRQRCHEIHKICSFQKHD